MRPPSAGSVLASLLERLEFRERLREYRVWNVWREVVGAYIADHAEPTRIEEGKLFVRVTTSTWMQELQCLKDEIRTKLNRRLGAPVVRDLFLVLAHAKRVADVASPAAPVEHPVAEADVDRLVPSLENPEIEAALRRVARAHLRRVGPDPA